MSFYEAVTELFYSRADRPEELAALETSPEYIARKQAFAQALEAIKDERTAQAVKQTEWDLLDIVSQFYYRMGLKDGASIHAGDFTAPRIA